MTTGAAPGLPRATLSGAMVAASRASALAALTGASVDSEALAIRLLNMVPPALADPLWQGIDQVPPGTALHIGPRQSRYRSWWTPPESGLPLDQGAPVFAAALQRAVETRAVGGVIASDLSGGLDSTPARDAVIAVSLSCAGQGCLPRSIAAALLCRARGTWPTWCTGIRPHPFTAHAWIEADGHPVDEPAPPGYYTPVITIPPPPAANPAR